MKRSFSFLGLLVLFAAMILAACAGSGGNQNAASTEDAAATEAVPATPAGAAQGTPDSTPMADVWPPLNAEAGETPQAGDLRPIEVADVQVQVGVGSPIPVNVFVSGAWPDLCAQLARIEQRVEGSTVDIALMAAPADPDCPPDLLGLPFSITLPLNMVEMDLGMYTVRVNGVETTFDWQAEPIVTEPVATP